MTGAATKNKAKLVLKPPYNELQWQQYYQLRWEVLRKPWGQPQGSERDELESSAMHLLARINNQAAGVGRLHSLDSQTAQIRYMAVDEQYQRKQIGSKILLGLEKMAADMGIKTIHLNARTSHHAFYLQHHYDMTGKGHTLYGEITHFKMIKQL